VLESTQYISPAVRLQSVHPSTEQHQREREIEILCAVHLHLSL